MYNTVLHGDCLELMKDIADNYIDLTVTSPPYDNLRTYNGSLVWGEHIWKPIIKELYRITKQGGIVVWVVGDATIKGSETGTSFKQALWAKECGFNLHDTMIWNKDACRFPDKNRYYDCFEYMFIFSKGKINTINQISDKKNKWGGSIVHGTNRMKDGTTKKLIGHNKKNIKDYGVRYNIWTQHNAGKANNIHPAVFPEQLARDHIISWSNEGDLVLDCFGGSGTTAIACINTNRNYILMEQEQKYIDIINERIKNHTKQKCLF